MKTAIVYDRVNKWGGAEQVLLVLHEMFPDASLYTSVYSPQNAVWAKVFPKIIPSFLQKIPFAQDHHEFFAPLMPLAFEGFDFSSYDLVISVTSEAAKGIITNTDTKHICICLTPTRYLWSGYDDYFPSTILKTGAAPIVAYLRHWDKIVAHRPDTMIAISTEVKKRIKKYYNRNASVVFPPTDISKFKNKNRWIVSNKDYFLIVSRLIPYKKIELAIDAFNKNGNSLIIVGIGSEAENLKARAKSNIKFLGFVNEKRLLNLYSEAKAVIFPQYEDFGLVAVEAIAAGTPVIGYKKGGILDIVKDGHNGIFFEKQTPEALNDAINRFFTIKWSNAIITSTAQKFSKEKFQKEFLRIVNSL